MIQKWNNHKCWCERKNQKEDRVCQKSYIYNPSTFAGENRKYLRSIIDDSVVTCNETINAADIVSTNVTSGMSKSSYNKKARHKANFYFLVTFVLVIILLFIIVIICYH